MDIFKDCKIAREIHARINGMGLKVVLPEGEDDRVISACSLTPGITKILLGNKEVIMSKLSGVSKEVMDEIQIIDESEYMDEDLIELFLAKRKGKLDREGAEKLILNANYYATLLLESNKVDALIGGCVYSTADILKPAFQIIKPAPGNSVVSSTFIMSKGEEKLLFADCAVNLNPNKEQLKEITLQTIETAKKMGITPKVAMLSYSTKGSGSGEYVDLVREAYELLIEEHPELIDIVDGELQFDAAYVPKIAKLKCPDSKVAGSANVFIFPHIAAGNIAYKMVQQLGGYEAIGPLLQGLNKPVNDLSRGTDDITIAKVMYISLRDN